MASLTDGQDGQTDGCLFAVCGIDYFLLYLFSSSLAWLWVVDMSTPLLPSFVHPSSPAPSTSLVASSSFALVSLIRITHASLLPHIYIPHHHTTYVHLASYTAFSSHIVTCIYISPASMHTCTEPYFNLSVATRLASPSAQLARLEW